MRAFGDIVFWVVYVVVESYLVFSSHQWGYDTMTQSLLFHSGVLIPRIIITYIFIVFCLPNIQEARYHWIFKVMGMILFFIFSLFIYRAILNIYFWPLIMGVVPEFDVFNLRLNAYSSMKLLTPLCLLTGIYAIRNEYDSRLNQSRLEKEKFAAELKYLKSQINPHFLFNTLNSIFALSLEKSDRTPDAIAKLSSLFRYILEMAEKDLVPISYELKVLSDYLGLEALRYDDSLEVQYNVNIGSDQFYLPPLLFLPFVENMFKHGSSESIHGSFVHINIEKQGNYICLETENSFEQVRIKSENSKGTGIQNVVKRLDLLFENDYEYYVMANDGEYKVKLKIPIQNMEHAD